jgi:tetratricopeptide (TPR) repeat protein
VGAIVANVKTVHMIRFSLIACTALLPRSVAAALLLLSFSAARADLPPLAQEAFNKGITANSKADYAQAIVDFQDARKQVEAKGVFPAPELYQKLGEVESKMPGRELRAICWFGAYLSANPQAADVAQIKAQMMLLNRTSRDNIRRLIQLTEDTGQVVAAHERARHNVEGSLDDVVVLWDEFGNYSKAQKIADTIEYIPERCETYNRISWARVDAGDFVGAWETIAKQEKAAGPVNDDPYIGYHSHLDLVLLEAHMAMEQANVGDMVSAKKAISAAKSLADLFTHSYSISQAYRSLAEAQAAAGDIDGAKKSVEHIKGEDARADHKFDAQLAISEAQIKAGDREGARETLAASGKTADLIPQADTKLEKRLALAKAQVKAGDGTGARETLATAVAELRNNSVKEPNAYYSLSLAQASGGDINGAKKTANYIQNSDDKAAPWTKSTRRQNKRLPLL